jgi:hypothetical protein
VRLMLAVRAVMMAGSQSPVLGVRLEHHRPARKFTRPLAALWQAGAGCRDEHQWRASACSVD